VSQTEKQDKNFLFKRLSALNKELEGGRGSPYLLALRITVRESPDYRGRSKEKKTGSSPRGEYETAGSRVRCACTRTVHYPTENSIKEN